MEAATGRIIHVKSSSDLIREGYLTPPLIQIYPISVIKGYRDWPLAYQYNILENVERNTTIKKLAQHYASCGDSVLIIVNRVECHGVVLHEAIEGSALLVGDTATEERQEIFEHFEKKIIKILISTVVNEGVNIPSMDVIIMAAGGKSSRAVIQRVGRCLRKSEGKTEARIIDFLDQDGKVLERHSNARISTYKSEEAFKYEEMPKFTGRIS